MADEKKDPEKRIIIDEDWKSQVQSEKQQADKSKGTPSTSNRPALPPASFSVLLLSYATQALISLGVLPNPLSEKTEADLQQAKHLIDMLGVLEEKTKGNLTSDEAAQLNSLLFDLRLKYVEATKSADGPARRDEGGELNAEGGNPLPSAGSAK